MSFDVSNYAVFNIFGLEVWLTETIVNTWVVMTVLIILALIIRRKLGSYKETPTGLQNVVEAVIEAFDRFVRTSAGEKLAFLGNWFFAVFLFILFSNLSGLVPLFRPPTADWTVTFSLALVTFCLIQVMGAKYRGKAYFKSFLEPIFIFLPLNIIGELARPISLSFRLFGNMLAGMILMTIFYSLTPWFVQIAIPAALHAYFDLVAALLQTYIFTVLSLSFIGAMAETTE
jgi:F-type H+-transporting ATPase subunit a